MEKSMLIHRSAPYIGADISMDADTLQAKLEEKNVIRK
jgi:hypothetical protein